jgi:pimeloyl-ACP methyl ester carboxylesterase
LTKETTVIPRQREVLALPAPEGGVLQGDLCYTGEPGAWAVVYVHGFGGERRGEKSTAVEGACARRGWTFAAFDFRGHGQSSGTLFDLRCHGLLADLDTIQAALALRGVQRLCLIGSSMGGWASSWFSTRRPEAVLACVLLAPAVHFTKLRWAGLDEAERRAWQQTGRLPAWNFARNRQEELSYELLEEMRQFPAEQLAAQLHTPLLVFHGMADDVVPYQHSLGLIEQLRDDRAELRLLKDGDHRLSLYKEEIAEAACAFFARHAG